MNITYLRSFRLYQVAMFDYIASVVFFAIIFKLFGISNSLRNYLMIVPIAIISHELVGQKSTINTNLFNEEINGYKIFVLVCVIYILTTFIF